MINQPATPNSRPSLISGERVAFFLVILLAMAYKSNDALSNPQFWAEDATVFFKEQFGTSLPQLFTPYAGYLHFIPRLVAWFASWLPVVKAPLIYNASAILLTTAAIVVTCRRMRPFVPVWIVALSFLAVPTSGEILGTITNAQWFLQFPLAALCLTPYQPARGWMVWLRPLTVLAISLTGPFSVVLALVIAGMISASYVARTTTRDPFNGALGNFAATRDWTALAALCIGAIVQAAVVVTHPAGEAVEHQNILILLKITFGELVPIHAFGSSFLSPTLWLLMFAVIVGTLTFSNKIEGRSRLIVLGFFAFAAAETFAPVRLRDFSPLYQFLLADRYFYLIKVVLWWMVWLSLSSVTRRSRLNATISTTALLCMVAVTNQHYLRRPTFVEFDWRHHASLLGTPGSHTVPLNPQGWGVIIDSKPSEGGVTDAAATPAAPPTPAPSSSPAVTDNQAQKLDGDLRAADRETIKCRLDLASGSPATGSVVVHRGEGASFEGWAFEPGQPALADAQLVFQGAAGSYLAKVKGGAARPDVASAFGPEQGNAGFTTVVDISSVAAGQYALWLATGTGEADKACDLQSSIKIED